MVLQRTYVNQRDPVSRPQSQQSQRGARPARRAPPVELPSQSRIPPKFHVPAPREGEAPRMPFPTRRPEGDAETALLEDALSRMWDDWRAQLDEHDARVRFPLTKDTVLQMLVYEIWSAIEGARVWDLGLHEARLRSVFSSHLLFMHLLFTGAPPSALLFADAG